MSESKIYTEMKVESDEKVALDEKVVEPEMPSFSNTYDCEYLDRIRLAIESMPAHTHINILRILCKHPECTLNENLSGTRVNMRFLSTEVIDELVKYMRYITIQEKSLVEDEDEKRRYTDMYNASHPATSSSSILG